MNLKIAILPGDKIGPEIIERGIKATIRMLNIIENELKPGLMDKILSRIA